MQIQSVRPKRTRGVKAALVLAVSVMPLMALAACGGTAADEAGSGEGDASATPSATVAGESAAASEPMNEPWNQPGLEGPVTTVGFGGTFSEAEFKYVWNPFTELTGVEIKEVPWAPDIYEKIESQIAANRVDIDQFSVTAGQYKELAECCLEPIDYSMFSQEVLDSMPEEYKLEKAVGFAEASIIIAFSQDAFPDGGKQPQSWADFWNIEEFPGKRSFQNFEPVKVIEAALLADGVAPESIYPLDWDRAFAKLEEIKPHVVKWWGSGTEAQQLLATGEASIIAMSNARIESLIEEGVNVDYTLNQALTHVDFLAVPKGAPHSKASMASIAFRFQPEIGAAVGEAWRQPIPSTTIFDAANPDIAKNWTTSTKDNPERGGVPNDIKFPIDSFYWYEIFPGSDKTSYEVVMERFQALIAS